MLSFKMENNMSRIITLTLVALFLAVSPALAEGTSLVGWGPRVGLASNPDQITGGAHWNLGRIHSQLRFVPNVMLGFGDDQTILETTLPFHWMFDDVNADFTPYAGGGLAIGWVHRDLPNNSNGDEDDLELALKAIGGMEWRLKNNKDFFVEISLDFGDLHDFQAIAGWTFRTRSGRRP